MMMMASINILQLMIMICKHEYFAADDDKRKYSAADDDGKHKYSALEVIRPVSALSHVTQTPHPSLLNSKKPKQKKSGDFLKIQKCPRNIEVSALECLLNLYVDNK